MLSTVINENTKSLRTAVLSSMFFYAPALLVMTTTDFARARADAQADPVDPIGEGMERRVGLLPTPPAALRAEGACREGAPLLLAQSAAGANAHSAAPGKGAYGAV